MTEETEVRIQKSGNNTQGLDLIYIQKVGEVVSVTDAKYATLVTTQAVVVPEDVKVLAVKAGATGITTTEVAAGTVLPANTAVLVNAEEGSYAFTVSSETGTALGNNDLKPGTGSAATGTQYCLTKTDDGKVGFAKVATTVTIPTTKAYLEVSSEYASVNFFALDDNTATAIKSIEAAQSANGAYYTLQGVKVEKPTKGIYVHNGKKVVIK